MSTFSSRLLALPNSMSRGLVPVRLAHGALLPDRSGCLLAGQLAVDISGRRLPMVGPVLCTFRYVEDGRVVVGPVGPLIEGGAHQHVLVQFAIMYASDPSVRSLVDGMVGPLRTWDDFEAANLLIEEVALPLAPAPRLG